MKTNFDTSGLKFGLLGALVFFVGWMLALFKFKTIGFPILLIGFILVFYGMGRHFVIIFKKKKPR